MTDNGLHGYRLLRTEVFQVSARVDNKQFLIHGGLLSLHSEFLSWRVNELLGFRENLRIDIEGHDGATVGRFAEFLYTGNYEAPGPVKIEDTPRKRAMEDRSSYPETAPTKDITTQECGAKLPCPVEVSPDSTHPELEISEPSDPPELDAPPVDDILGTPPSEPPPTDPPEAPQGTLTPEDRLEIASEKGLLETGSDETSHFDPSKFDFRDAFLAHGKACALAHSLDIEPLEKLAIVRLEEVFSKITTLTPEAQVVSNFAELVGYAYEKSKSKKLREALLKFFSPNVSVLKGLELHKLVSRCGDLASDVMEILCAKLEGSERENGQLLLDVKTLDTKLKFLAEKNQEQVVAQGELERTLEKKWSALHLKMCGQAEDLIAIQRELKEAKQIVVRERSEKKAWAARCCEFKDIVEGIEKQKEMLMVENGTIKEDLEKAKEKNVELRKRIWTT